MRQQLTFVHPTTLSTREVPVGPDHLLIIAGVLAAAVRAVDVLGELDLPWAGYAAAVLLVHARHWRHSLSWPVLGSVAVALSSFGLSAFFSGAVIHRLVAQHYRDAGWKIRNTDGQLGEYSSRFLAMDRLGFNESDLMEAVARRHLDAEYIGGGAVRDDQAPAATPAATPGLGAGLRPRRSDALEPSQH
jgi:hypothetical protein